MNFTSYTAIKNKFTKAPNLCDLFKLLSIETWKRMEYAYLRPGVKIFETTITQNLIFSINAYNDQFNLGIKIFEAENENANGNDMELIIQYPGEGLEFYAPIQAKKIYRNGKYNSMDHGDQIEKLRNYAQLKNTVPFYLLYNHTPNSIGTVHSPSELNGCTIVNADHLFNNYYNKRTVHRRNGIASKGWIIPDFDNLNPSPALQWHSLVCPSSSTDFVNMVNKNGIIVNPNPLNKLGYNIAIPSGFFPLNSHQSDKHWISLKALKNQELGFSPEEKTPYTVKLPRIMNESKIDKHLDSYWNEQSYSAFLPKTRIVITRQSDNG